MGFVRHMAKGLPSLLLAGAFFLVTGCASGPILERSPEQFQKNIDLADKLRVESSVGTFTVQGLPWRMPTGYSELIERIRQRFNASGKINVPEGMISGYDCEGYQAKTLADGRILICRDVFRLAQTEDEIAFVAGHELGHIMLRHNVRDGIPGGILTAGAIATLGALIALHDPSGSLTAAGYQIIAPWITLSAAEGAAGAYLNTFRLPEELDADRIGVDLMASAGYDTEVVVGVIEALPSGGTDSAGRSLTDWRPHPETATRANEMRSYLDRMKYPEPTEISAPLPWGAGMSPDANTAMYLESLRRVAEVDGLARGVYRLRMAAATQSVFGPAARQQATNDAEDLCVVLQSKAYHAKEFLDFSDRSAFRRLVVDMNYCQAQVGYDWLEELARRPEGGLLAADDLMGYWAHIKVGIRTEKFIEFWRSHMRQTAFEGDAFRIAYSFAWYYGQSGLADELFAACAENEGKYAFNCLESARSIVDTDTMKLRTPADSWDEILLHVQAPTARQIDAYRDQAIAEVRAGLPARSAIAEAELERIRANGLVAQTKVRTPLRVSPAKNAKTSFDILANARVLVLQRGPKGWIKIESGEEVGWIAADSIR